MDSGQLTTESEQRTGTDPIRVLRVAEGQAGTAADGMPNRIFSVVLSRTAGEDLGIVASAVDPGRAAEKASDFRPQASGATEATETAGAAPGEAPAAPEACSLKPEAYPCHIPAPGDPHPTMPGYVAQAPLIFSVGIRSKDGAMLAACSNFYNVRVRYEKLQASDFRLQASGTDETAETAGGPPGEALAVPEARSLKPEALATEGSDAT
jgi:hypothetical protein